MRPPLPAKVIIFCLPGIGDAILFTPALALLRRALPAARLTAITMFRGTAEILATNPDLDEVRHFDFFNAGWVAGLKYVAALRREQFDLSLMPFPANRREYSVVNWLTGARWRAAHRYQHHRRRNFYFLNNIVATEQGDLHNVEENLQLAQTICQRLGIDPPPVDSHLKLRLTETDHQRAETFVQEHQLADTRLLIGFHTHSSTFKNMHRKCWDKDRFATLIQRLAVAYPSARFLIFSGPSDAAVNREILKQVDGRAVLVEETSLRHALAILQRCRLFISNDSGIMHLAAALAVPVVALFGPTNWRRLYPWIESRAVVHAHLPCMPCFFYSSRPLHCPAGLNYACLSEISVDQVLAAAQDLLSRTQSHDTVTSC